MFIAVKPATACWEPTIPARLSPTLPHSRERGRVALGRALTEMRAHYCIPIALYDGRAQHKASILRFPLRSLPPSTNNYYTVIEFEGEHTLPSRLDELAYQHVCEALDPSDSRLICGAANVALHRRLLPE